MSKVEWKITSKSGKSNINPKYYTINKNETVFSTTKKNIVIDFGNKKMRIKAPDKCNIICGDKSMIDCGNNCVIKTGIHTTISVGAGCELI